jgi:hypothetical protein
MWAMQHFLLVVPAEANYTGGKEKKFGAHPFSTAGENAT